MVNVNKYEQMAEDFCERNGTKHQGAQSVAGGRLLWRHTRIKSAEIK